MAATGLPVWDKSVQTTNIWLDEIMEAIGPDRQAAWHALGAVLRTLRDRLPVELAAHLGAQLPLLVRGTYYEQWHISSARPKARDMEDFLDLVDAHLGRGPHVGAAAATEAVLRTMARHIDAGQIAKVLAAMPTSIRRLLGDAAEA